MSGPGVVAVTGASGFIGSVLVGTLSGVGRVRALQRKDRPREVPGAVMVRGDLADRPALESLCDGADTVIHAAATMAKGDLTESWRVNVNGTEAVLRAAAAAGCGRFVYVGSTSIFGATRPRDGVLTEDDEPAGVDELNAYARTKLEGERLTRRLADRLGMEHVVVRPTNVYGPGSVPWFRMYERLLRRVPVAFGRIPIDLVYVSDVVDGIVAAASAPQAAGRIFHLGHEMIELADFVEAVAGLVGRRSRRLPGVVDALVRVGVEQGYRWATGRRLSLSLRTPVLYSRERAAELLGYAPSVRLADGFRLIGGWYRSGSPLPAAELVPGRSPSAPPA